MKDNKYEENLEYTFDLTLRINKLDCVIDKEAKQLYNTKISLKEHRKEHTLLLKEREGYLLKLIPKDKK